MAAPVDDSRIVVPFMPTLFHLAVVKVALPLYNDFFFLMLREVNENIENEASQHLRSASSDAGSSGNMAGIYNRAKEELLLIPLHLRKSVLVAAHGFEELIRAWEDRHEYMFLDKYDGKITFYWRYDGSLDFIKTAEQLVLNNNISIKKRFEMACSYCFVESIQTLWSQIKESHDVGRFERRCLERFWIRWMSDESRDHWEQDFVEYVCNFPPSPMPRMSSCYRLLPPHYKQKYFSFFETLSWDDARFCLYAMNEEEQAEMVRRKTRQVLCLYLEWPLRAFFLEKADKMWDFMDVECFLQMVHILFHETQDEDIDCSELLEGFWNRSPPRLKEHEGAGEPLRRKIENCLNLNRSKKKAVRMNEHQKEVI